MAKEKGLGVIAKRPAANSPWRFKEQPFGRYAEVYWLRLKKMNILQEDNLQETALRFAAYTWGVDTVIAGTSNLEHLRENIKMVEKGPLDQDYYNKIRDLFRNYDDNWIGQV
jgi:aryl-alcohol dehydrogenase-like predicted oxidoreductase